MTSASKNNKPTPRGGAPARERELRAQGKKTIAKLLDAAMKAFGQRGYHATRVDDIVKLAKTSHGTFYLYYANKEDLLRALIADCSEEMEALAGSLGHIDEDETGYAELRSWLERYTELYTRYGPVMRAWTEAAETPGSEFAKLGQQTLAGFSRSLAERIAEVDHGDAIDPGVAAVAFVAMVDRFNTLMLLRQVRFDRETVLDTLAAITHVGVFGGNPTPVRLVAAGP
jgi:AcrR family transcriptional regulator